MRMSVLLSIFIFTSCSMLDFKQEKPDPPKVKFKQDVSVTIGDQKVNLAAGKTLEFTSDQPILVEANGRVPIFVYPVASKNKNLNINLPKLDETKLNKVHFDKINRELDSILPEVQQVQVMLLKRDYINALSKIRDLRAKHPKVAFLSFIEGSTYMILNRKSEAIKALNEGLQIYPDSAEAKELYKQLTERGF